MHRKVPGLPKGFWEGLSRPVPRNAEARLGPMSHFDQLRQSLAEYYHRVEQRGKDASASSELDQESWEQSGQVLRWLGEHVLKSEAYRRRLRSIRPNEKFHRQLVASLVNRIKKGEPLAYVLGSQPFGPIEILCEKPTLIPRPETEHLFEHLSDLIRRGLFSTFDEVERQSPLRILDLCTGSGCIALLLQHRLFKAEIQADITAIDKSIPALHLIRQNQTKAQTLARNDISRIVIEKVDVFNDDEVDHLVHRHGPFDIVASNPPYIPTLEWESLDQNVKNWEDPEALIGDVDGTSDGLEFYRRIAHLIKRKGLLSHRLSSVPSLLVEVGHNQAKRVQDLFIDINCFRRIELVKDPWSHDRGVMGWSSRPPRH